MKVKHSGFLTDFKEPAIFKALTFSSNITDKLFKTEVSSGFIRGDIGKGKHPLRMALSYPTSPVVSHSALMLSTAPTSAVERLCFAAGLI